MIKTDVLLNIKNCLKEKDIKVTPQRLEVYKALMNYDTHLSVEEIFNKVRENNPSVSLGTIYAILANFRDNGLVKEVKIDSERSFFEMQRDTHQHFLCYDCKNIYDVDFSKFSCFEHKSIDGHKIDDFHGYFYGICKNCSKKKAKQ